MAVLGKRKRRDQITESDGTNATDHSPSTDANLQALFRQHFEAKFKPLPQVFQNALQQPQPYLIDSEELSNESDWSGLSDGEDDNGVEVIEHTNSTGARRIEVPRDEVKTFMTTKPPTSTASPLRPSKTPTNPSPTAAEKEDTLANLKNDIALQRLLSESHLLSPSSPNPSSSHSNPKTLSLRLGLDPTSDQQKMPLSHRKGIEAKKREKEDRRRREARENGVVLEVEKRQKGKAGKRERGIGGPSVGRFRGGVLMLSERDLRSIQGSGGSGGRGGGKNRGGKRGGSGRR